VLLCLPLFRPLSLNDYLRSERVVSMSSLLTCLNVVELVSKRALLVLNTLLCLSCTEWLRFEKTVGARLTASMGTFLLMTDSPNHPPLGVTLVELGFIGLMTIGLTFVAAIGAKRSVFLACRRRFPWEVCGKARGDWPVLYLVGLRVGEYYFIDV